MKSFEYAAPATLAEAADLLGDSWGLTEVDAPTLTKSQNNDTPRGLFSTHALVKIKQGNTITLYDPSYGITTTATATGTSLAEIKVAVDAALKTYENQAISFYGLATDKNPNSGFKNTYLMKANDPKTLDVVRLQGVVRKYTFVSNY